MKKLLLLFMLVLIIGCVSYSENTSISYVTELKADVDKKELPKVEHKTASVPSSDDCYERLKPLLEKGIPVKPNITSDEKVDTILLNSIKLHREYIRALIDRIETCKH